MHKELPNMTRSPEGPNYGARRLVTLLGALVVGAVASAGAIGLSSTSEQHPPVSIKIDNVDSDGNHLSNYSAAIEDIAQETFRQLDELHIEEPEQRQIAADSVIAATEEAIANEPDGSLVNNNVSVSIRKDVWGDPLVAVVRQK